MTFEVWGEAEVAGEKPAQKAYRHGYSLRPMKKLTALAALFCTLSLTVCDADAAKPKAKEQAPMTEEQKTLTRSASDEQRARAVQPHAEELAKFRRASPTAWLA
jgi:hypothetical protein